MISLHRSSGTLLYPLLGRGFHGSTYGTYLTPYSEITAGSIALSLWGQFTDLFVLLPLVVGILAARSASLLKRQGIIALLAGAISGALTMLVVLGGYNPYRYTFSFLFAATLVGMTLALSARQPTGQAKPLNSRPVALFLAAVAIGNLWPGAERMYRGIAANIRFQRADWPLVPAAEISRYRNIQQAVPKGAVLLARVSKPFLLDFTRHNVYVPDYPGGASPPPGMPFGKGPEVLAQYLLSNAVRYVAFSYGDSAGYTEEKQGWKLSKQAHPFSRTAARGTFDFQKDLAKLGQTRRRVYDDGKIFVLDLQTASPGGEFRAPEPNANPELPRSH